MRQPMLVIVLVVVLKHFFVVGNMELICVKHYIRVLVLLHVVNVMDINLEGLVCKMQLRKNVQIRQIGRNIVLAVGIMKMIFRTVRIVRRRHVMNVLNTVIKDVHLEVMAQS